MRICKIVNFTVPADHRINLKESEKKDKYLDLARELKKLWNMKVTIVPIVIGALGTITKGLLKGLENLEVGGRVETSQTTALLRTAKILRRVLETWGDLLKNHQPTLMWKTLISKNNYYYFFIPLRVFHTNASWWFLSGVWVTASLIKSPGYFS